VRQAAQEKGRAGLAGNIGKRGTQRAARALVDAASGSGEFFFGVDAEDDAARLRRLGRERLYAKFHSESIA
jgi:hypothetical protein